MKCPFCAKDKDRVIDSRTSRDGELIRRRRECLKCSRRFTTYERVEENLPMVIKKDGRREPYDRQKVIAGIRRACEKRPVSTEQVEQVVRNIEGYLQDTGESEIASRDIGERVMISLRDLDQVAYVRFASVYREFKDLNAFIEQLNELLRKGPPAAHSS
ncbi:MAG: transcriptional repressor NrdR [Deltaproteobacteria bacterium]|nr:transcriptional repressor NrdR [Deltaproteobacteria bacterium]